MYLSPSLDQLIRPEGAVNSLATSPMRPSFFSSSVSRASVPTSFAALFESEEFLGEGAFGRVELVRAKTSYQKVVEGRHYAVKIFDGRGRNSYEKYCVGGNLEERVGREEC